MTDLEPLLAGLDSEQRAVATTLAGPVCVLAGAGTGKTRAITHRIAYGVATGTYDPARVLALTFTTRAAGELRSRLALLGAGGVSARTFHSAALRQARYFWPGTFGGQLPEPVRSKLPLLAEAVRRCRLPGSPALLRDLASEVEWAKVSNVGPEDFAAVASGRGRDTGGLDGESVARVFAAYEELKRERDRIDMEDVLLCGAALLAEDDRVAAQVRRQYRWFVVDEFQDVSPIQWALLQLWLGDRDDLCVVGDPMQTIYAFAGATPSYLTGFGARFPGCERIELVRNYRSTPQVLAVANAVSRRGGTAVTLVPQLPPGDSVTFCDHPDEVAEAEGVAAAIAALRDSGLPLREMAVLFRINAQSANFETALATRELPYRMRGVERFFERPEVKQATTLLRGAARAGSQATGDLLADTRAVLSTMGWTESAPGGAGEQRGRWESLQALTAVAAELAAADAAADLRGLVAELEHRAALQQLPVADGVTLATLHSAKGLEWDTVFLVGVHEGSVPIVHAATPAAVEEERRLLYVGITRARSRLCISWSRARSPGARTGRGPSRFLDGVRPADSGLPAPVAGARRRARSPRTVPRCRGCDRPLSNPAERRLRRCSDCPASYDEGLFEALRDWRTAQAVQQQVPAYCVFTDATLIAIAERRPGDAAALRAIPGVGGTKLDRYGDDVFALCAQARA